MSMNIRIVPAMVCFLLAMIFLVVVLKLIGRTPEPITKPNMSICKIIIPIGRMQSGWKLWDPADDGHISNLVRNNKAEIIHLPGLVECTVYIDNQTPVTTSSALAMWRRI